MYTSVTSGGLACARAGDALGGWLSLAALAVVPAVKVHFEEQWMLAAHPGYAAYRLRTWRLLPGLF